MPYTPKPPPRTSPEFQELYDYIEQELQSISRELLESRGLELRTTSKVPLRPREGMIVQADGTDWDPGEGAGTYKYESGVWKKFGDADHVHTLADITDAGTLAAADSVGTGDISGVATSRIIGRETAGTGVAEELTLSQVLDFIGSAAQGDLLVRGASAWARLGIGAANTVLQSDGTDPSWQPPSGAWTLLQSNNTTSGTNSDFADIPQTSKMLLIVGRQFRTLANANVNLRHATTSGFSAFNTHYRGSTAVSSTTFGGIGSTDETASGAFLALSSTTANSVFGILIPDYTSTTKHKVGLTFSQCPARTYMNVGVHVFATTNAIEHLRFALSTSSWNGGTIDMFGLF